MFLLTIGSAIIYMFATDAFEVAEKKPSSIYFSHPIDSRHNSYTSLSQPIETVAPLVEQQYKNIIHQAYDYSCGSAALTTVLNGYLGRQFTEKQVMDGLLKFGEYDKIVQRRGFSMLDMKRLVTALGHPNNGFKGTLDELKKLDHPALVAIHYMNFKHFVVIKKYQDGRFFVADPALGNISFPEAKFDEVWDKVDGMGRMFIIFPNGFKPQSTLELTESDMRFVSDETISHLAFMQIKENTYQAQRAADRASTLQRVFNADSNADASEKIINVPLRTYFRKK
ncbi:C39 family peptidase [Patescibacteria group bacterium]|nr:C39 family peptidase [Patescibacteria group bacterium]